MGSFEVVRIKVEGNELITEQGFEESLIVEKRTEDPLGNTIMDCPRTSVHLHVRFTPNLPPI